MMYKLKRWFTSLSYRVKFIVISTSLAIASVLMIVMLTTYPLVFVALLLAMGIAGLTQTLIEDFFED